MNIQVATCATAPSGFTRAVLASGGDYDLELLIRPDTDLDTRFLAWCIDSAELIRVNGWLFIVEEA